MAAPSPRSAAGEFSSLRLLFILGASWIALASSLSVDVYFLQNAITVCNFDGKHLVGLKGRIDKQYPGSNFRVGKFSNAMCFEDVENWNPKKGNAFKCGCENCSHPESKGLEAMVHAAFRTEWHDDAVRILILSTNSVNWAAMGVMSENAQLNVKNCVDSSEYRTQQHAKYALTKNNVTPLFLLRGLFDKSLDVQEKTQAMGGLYRFTGPEKEEMQDQIMEGIAEIVKLRTTQLSDPAPEAATAEPTTSPAPTTDSAQVKFWLKYKILTLVLFFVIVVIAALVLVGLVTCCVTKSLKNNRVDSQALADGAI